jgi:integrase
MLPGSHRVRAPLAGGRVAEYWYAWRGGPRILSVSANNAKALAAEVSRRLPAAIAEFQAQQRVGDTTTLSGLITRYLAALDTPEFAHLAERTKKDKREHLDRARDDLGKLELRALEARGARKLLIDWRDGMAKTPKTADDRLSDLSGVLTWAHDKGEIAANPVKDFKRIYHVDRSAIVWTEDELDAIQPHCRPELWWAIQLAAHTGARLGDLRKLTWTNVHPDSIRWQTGKSKGRRTAVAPMTPELRKLLAGIKRCSSTTILNSSRGKPWTEPGLQTALREAKLEAKIENRRWHDLRGTFVTRMVAAGRTAEQIAEILAWKPDEVREIIRRYCAGDVLAEGLLKRLENKAGPKSVKRSVKRASGGGSEGGENP